MTNRKFLSRLFIVLIALVAIIGLTACGKNQAGKETWERYESAVNNMNFQQMAECIYDNANKANDFAEKDAPLIVGDVWSIKTSSYKVINECDFSSDLGPDVYYAAEVVALINDAEKETFVIYSYKNSKGTFLCSAPNYNEEGKFGNEPTSDWYQKSYFTTDPFKYQIVKSAQGNKTVTISQYNKNLKEIAIPSEIDGLPVTAIGSYAFYRFNKVFSFTTKASKLKTITIPETVQSIGKYAFYQCGKLEEIDIPLTLTTISEYAFSSCVDLKTIQLNIDDTIAYANLKAVESKAVNGDIVISGGREIYAGDIIKLTAAGTGITQDRINWSVSSDAVALGTDGMNNAFLIANKNGSVTITATSKDNPGIKSTLTLNVKNITDVKDIAFKKIDGSAFNRCSGLQKIIITAINPNSITITGDSTMFSLNDMVRIYVPKVSVDMYKTHALWSKYADQIVAIEG